MNRIADFRSTDAVVVGSGLAGLSTALGLGRCSLLTRGDLGSGSSRMAQGGIAAAIGPGDSPERHAADTLAVSAGLGDERVARAVTAAAAGRVEWLRCLGARFDTTSDGLALGREAGHSARRIVHADGDATGAEVMRALVAAARARPDIHVYEGYELVDLLLRDGRVAGVVARAPGGELVALAAPAVVLATGGIGGLYARTTNPPEVMGDGLAAAARAGALLADLEFVQFHPTALAIQQDPVPLLTEGLRGEGALLVDEHGERFMAGLHPDAELAPRDIVARAVWQQQLAGRRVYLDATASIGTAFPERFPTVWKAALRAGVDPRSQGLPVTPAEHYYMGGVVTDLEGRTSLPGLWAVGEVACTGLHGANRLASNSLLEAMVLGAAASRSVAAVGLPPVGRTRLELPAGASVHDREPRGWQQPIRKLMWERAGLVREGRGLARALAELDTLERHAAERPCSLAERNLLLLARLVCEASLERRESRGAHWRVDCPRTVASGAARRRVHAAREPLIELPDRARRAA